MSQIEEANFSIIIIILIIIVFIIVIIIVISVIIIIIIIIIVVIIIIIFAQLLFRKHGRDFMVTFLNPPPPFSQNHPITPNKNHDRTHRTRNNFLVKNIIVPEITLFQ